MKKINKLVKIPGLVMIPLGKKIIWSVYAPMKKNDPSRKDLSYDPSNTKEIIFKIEVPGVMKYFIRSGINEATRIFQGVLKNITLFKNHNREDETELQVENVKEL